MRWLRKNKSATTEDVLDALDFSVPCSTPPCTKPAMFEVRWHTDCGCYRPAAFMCTFHTDVVEHAFGHGLIGECVCGLTELVLDSVVPL